ncbi:hypothetical protein C9I86_09645 [Photobacterium sp. NCIMB 13483]|uniref:hypothetical protein n=1 Tax=Photobacterium sp. NCIMB 13483 TaxID=2022103 RepID=UPI000D17A0CB|nr:hypothetical protein [Photobacterium sp. NCIMB 13483]PST90150.1 hypothetical protein C9I86_09645 [Photobacterium sp. NCIMB 13483]
MNDNQFYVEMAGNLAWPTVVLICVFLLRDKIKNIFSGGLKSAKYKDAELVFSEQQTAKPNLPVQQDLKHFIPSDPSGFREEVENRLQGSLAQIPSDQEKIDILVKNLAQEQLNGAFEKIYYNIFGTQIRLLEFLSSQESGAAKTTDILPFFEECKKSNPQSFSESNLSDYLNFFHIWELLEFGDDQYIITKKGRAFLRYITAMRLNKNKAF